jgi:hypothetical protein
MYSSATAAKARRACVRCSRISAGPRSFRAQLFARYHDAVYSTIMSQLALRVSSLCALLLGAAAALEGRSAVW